MPNGLNVSETCLNEPVEIVLDFDTRLEIDPSCGFSNTICIEHAKAGDIAMYDGCYCIGVKRKPPLKIANSKRWGKRRKPLRLM